MLEPSLYHYYQNLDVDLSTMLIVPLIDTLELQKPIRCWMYRKIVPRLLGANFLNLFCTIDPNLVFPTLCLAQHH